MLKDYKIRYVSSTGQELDLSGGAIDAHGNTMPAWELETVALNNRIVGFSRVLPEVTFALVISSDDDAGGVSSRNSLYEIPASDRARLQPGKLYFNDWYISGYFKASTPDNFWQTRKAAYYELTFVASEPMWTREKTKTFMPQQLADGVDYPLDFSFDYTGSVNFDTIDNENYSPSFVRIVVQGAASEPSVTIAGNEYRVDAEIGAGEYLEIDGLSKKVVVVGTDGSSRNVFAKRHGRQVEGSGHYVFEKIPAGESSVLFSDGLTFSVTVIEQREEPRWA